MPVLFDSTTHEVLYDPTEQRVLFQPSGVCCYFGGSCDPTHDQSFCELTGGTWKGDADGCTPNPCTGVCCCPCECPVACHDDLSHDDCSALCPGCNAWLLNGTCAANGCSFGCCAPPPGACCRSNGSGPVCSIETEDNCHSGGGIWQGACTNCTGVVCPVGACCFSGLVSSTQCDIRNVNECALASGVYFDGVTCADACPPGCCCQTNTCSQSAGGVPGASELQCTGSYGGTWRLSPSNCGYPGCDVCGDLMSLSYCYDCDEFSGCSVSGASTQYDCCLMGLSPAYCVNCGSDGCLQAITDPLQEVGCSGCGFSGCADTCHAGEDPMVYCSGDFPCDCLSHACGSGGSCSICCDGCGTL